jgi:hypothetical protein
MGSPNPFPGSYNSQMLAELQAAFDAAWAELRTLNPSRDATMGEELRILLSKRSIALADEGITDAVTLRKLAMQSVRLNLQGERVKSNRFR